MWESYLPAIQRPSATPRRRPSLTASTSSCGFQILEHFMMATVFPGGAWSGIETRAGGATFRLT
jgi:hypothetical protein